MNRAKLLLVFVGAALLGTGCHSTCDYGDIALFWHFPNPTPNGPELTCDQAGVADVQITIDGTSQQYPCVMPDVNGNPAQGLTLTSFARNVQYQFEVDGLDQNGNVVYSTSFTYTPPACGLNILDETLDPTQGEIVLDLSGGAFTQCAPGTYVWYSLTDVTNPQAPQVVSVVDGLNSPTSIQCTGTVSIPNVPVGQYQFDFVQIVEPTGQVQQPYSAVWQDCSPVPFNHATASDTVNVPLQAATTTCPGS